MLRSSARRRLLALAVTALLAMACGARSALKLPSDTTTTTDAGDGPLVCPSWKSCGGATEDCLACALPRVARCAKITDCDPGSDRCEGVLPSNHACRVWAAEAVACFLDCASEPNQTPECESSFFDDGLGPIFPFGLAFADYRCAVCQACGDACASSPNFATLCD
jgi:hypothetical protein